jgi:hypothetical protein
MARTFVSPWDTGAFGADDAVRFAQLTFIKGCATCQCAEKSRLWFGTVSMLIDSGQWSERGAIRFMGMGSTSWDALKAVAGLDIPESSTSPSKGKRVRELSDRVGQKAKWREATLLWLVERMFEEKTRVEQRARQAEAQLGQLTAAEKKITILKSELDKKEDDVDDLMRDCRAAHMDATNWLISGGDPQGAGVIERQSEETVA